VAPFPRLGTNRYQHRRFLEKEQHMAKAGQHHNAGLSSSKPRGHETSRGRNRPDRSQEITTGSYKKQETYRRQALEHSPNTTDQGAQAANQQSWNDDIRDAPDTTSGSTRARESSLHGRSGSDSNADTGSRGH
jgi:hypothetical protein